MAAEVALSDHHPLDRYRHSAVTPAGSVAFGTRVRRDVPEHSERVDERRRMSEYTDSKGRVASAFVHPLSRLITYYRKPAVGLQWRGVG